ncbi:MULTISPECIES: hypothetical protein [Amycolatopsis]|uniref:hypothetical protein n=1 Tax=Amycolatopsis TaxID=1813 RepID=UPI000A57115F|nr:hypothetical protein [Amycolatopsis sacchari]
MPVRTEPETLADLIGDCADIPAELREQHRPVPPPPTPRGWAVDEACQAQVAGLDG